MTRVDLPRAFQYRTDAAQRKETYTTIFFNRTDGPLKPQTLIQYYNHYKTRTLQSTRTQFHDPIHLYIYIMTFDVLDAITSSPQLYEIYDAKLRSLYIVLWYDTI